MDEVRNVVHKSKYKKSVGVDQISYEVLKNENAVKLMTYLFNMCFDYNLIPDVWTKAVIAPIYKGSPRDPRIPMNYRGISLLSSVYKLFSSVLNNRLTEFIEYEQLIVEEQNGFRKGRACIDHVFSLTSVIHIEKGWGFQPFVASLICKKLLIGSIETCYYIS